MNIHTIIDGRLVEDPREFDTKDGRKLLSIRVADNPMGRDSKYQPMFVSFVLSEGLTAIARSRGLAKGDIVSVSGDLRIRTYEKTGGKKGKKGDVGIAYEMPFVQAFRIQSCAAEGGEAPADESEAPAKPARAVVTAEANPFGSDDE